MKNLENINLESLTTEELENTNGGCDFCFFLGRALALLLN